MIGTLEPVRQHPVISVAAVALIIVGTVVIVENAGSLAMVVLGVWGMGAGFMFLFFVFKAP